MHVVRFAGCNWLSFSQNSFKSNPSLETFQNSRCLITDFVQSTWSECDNKSDPRLQICSQHAENAGMRKDFLFLRQLFLLLQDEITVMESRELHSVVYCGGGVLCLVIIKHVEPLKVWFLRSEVILPSCKTQNPVSENIYTMKGTFY